MEKNRCGWPSEDSLMIKYHDEEWGLAVHDDKIWFEYLLLDGFQAGLSWKTILHKRENFRKAFDDFEYKKIAEYSDEKLEELRQDVGIIRNRLKIAAQVTNAKVFMKIQKEHGSFDEYIWQFTNGKVIQNKCQTMSDIPATSSQSDAMSKQMKKDGFKFVGSTICYAMMQAAGMVNDHIVTCFRHTELV
jgi:DNA-3-methyladenine glycosylase I